MGAETLKTHLSHVYDKLGIRNRAPSPPNSATRRQTAARSDARGAERVHRHPALPCSAQNDQRRTAEVAELH
jgi:hypothetical protein